jgi:hypothetical protein
MDASTRNNRTAAIYEGVRREGKNAISCRLRRQHVMHAVLIWRGNIRRLSRYLRRIFRMLPVKNH